MSGEDTPAYSPISQTRGETEGQRATARFVQVREIALRAGFDTQQTKTNTDTDDRVIEFVSMRLRGNFTNNLSVELIVNAGEQQGVEFAANTLHFPFSFDPGLTWLEGEDVQVNLFNDSGSTLDIALNIAYIPLE